MDDDLALALELADAADAITLGRFRAADLVVTTKPDTTPVTDADQAAEAEVRRLLARARPGDAVLGEEEGETAGTGGRRWIVDPIDGTKSYARGVAVWATLLALEVDGEVVLGVVSAPALHRRWWASRGGGAWADDGLFEPGTEAPRRLAVSQVSALSDASLSYSSLSGWAARPQGLGAFLGLADACWRTRAYGDFWSHVQVAEGCVDLSCEPEVSRWDLAALQPIVEEAGGRFTDLSGVRGPGGGSVLASNGRLHDAALALLTPERA
ncbi:MAG TPA: histidinol-phosphatase [Mycobacteriales bacterium]|nr:histidinol-phosphatase [Mycobacteriales bacterium]